MGYDASYIDGVTLPTTYTDGNLTLDPISDPNSPSAASPLLGQDESPSPSFTDTFTTDYQDFFQPQPSTCAPVVECLPTFRSGTSSPTQLDLTIDQHDFDEDDLYFLGTVKPQHSTPCDQTFYKSTTPQYSQSEHGQTAFVQYVHPMQGSNETQNKCALDCGQRQTTVWDNMISPSDECLEDTFPGTSSTQHPFLQFEDDASYGLHQVTMKESFINSGTETMQITQSPFSCYNGHPHAYGYDVNCEYGNMSSATTAASSPVRDGSLNTYHLDSLDSNPNACHRRSSSNSTISYNSKRTRLATNMRMTPRQVNGLNVADNGERRTPGDKKKQHNDREKQRRVTMRGQHDALHAIIFQDTIKAKQVPDGCRLTFCVVALCMYDRMACRTLAKKKLSNPRGPKPSEEEIENMRNILVKDVLNYIHKAYRLKKVAGDAWLTQLNIFAATELVAYHPEEPKRNRRRKSRSSGIDLDLDIIPSHDPRKANHNANERERRMFDGIIVNQVRTILGNEDASNMEVLKALTTRFETCEAFNRNVVARRPIFDESELK